MEQYSEMQEILERRLSELTRRITAIQGDRRHESIPLEKDFEEQATQRENDEVLDALDGAGRAELGEVRRALESIRDGSYGICRVCGERIPDKRLRALPTATACVTCASV